MKYIPNKYVQIAILLLVATILLICCLNFICRSSNDRKLKKNTIDDINNLPN